MTNQKRIIASVIIKDDLAVQSFSYKKYLPLGKPEVVVENLNWWGADEIIIIDIDRTRQKKEPNYKIIDQIVKKNLSTPLMYSGGIRTKYDAKNIVNSGVERICVENIINENPKVINDISGVVGAQAIVLSIPIVVKKNNVYYYDYIKKKNIDIEKNKIKLIDRNSYSEILITDKENEGSKNLFNLDILKKINFKKNLILFGGITGKNKINHLLSKKNVSAISIGNSLNYSEISYQNLKKNLKKNLIREEIFNIYE